ncbi:MAG: divergent polysaccharide deacetylase family protein [Desulfovibrionales bacterium]|nr:divergent polysaccharide deacetylase family protein [Desulfovibrionales bacterium]
MQPSDAGTPPLVYEAEKYDFEAKVRRIDMAILESLSALGEPRDSMRHKAVEARLHDGQEFFYQNLTIGLTQDVFPFLAELKRNLHLLAPESTLATVNDNPRDLEISVLGEPTHHIFIPLTIPPEPIKPEARAPRIVIVIDDMGESLNVAKRLADLPFPVSFSVLPHSTKARQVAKHGRENNLELLLHLPCEPEGYPKINSGPGTLRANMSPATLERMLVDNLNRLPEVDGVNNHMGSRLTRDKQAMTIVLSHLKGRGKFFLDSVTGPGGCVREISERLHMRYLRRHIFLDNTPKENSILLQLQKAESLARRTGLAVAIGHPYPATLKALETWTRTRDMRIDICKIQDI